MTDNNNTPNTTNQHSMTTRSKSSSHNYTGNIFTSVDPVRDYSNLADSISRVKETNNNSHHSVSNDNQDPNLSLNLDVEDSSESVDPVRDYSLLVNSFSTFKSQTIEVNGVDDNDDDNEVDDDDKEEVDPYRVHSPGEENPNLTVSTRVETRFIYRKNGIESLRFYPGTIKQVSYSPNYGSSDSDESSGNYTGGNLQYYIVYDDGDEKWVNLRRKTWRLEKPRTRTQVRFSGIDETSPVPTNSPTVAPNNNGVQPPRYNLRSGPK